MGERVRKTLLLLVLCWILPIIIFSIQIYTVASGIHRPVGVAEVIFWSFVRWYIWIPLSPAILWLGWRFPLAEAQLYRNILIHTAISMTIATGQLLLHNRARVEWLRGEQKATTYSASLSYLMLRRFPANILTYWLITGLGQTLFYFWRSREKEMEALRLENSLNRAELFALKQQLHPHFLFNTLNQISELIHTDPVTAERVVVRLGDLLRIALRELKTEVVTLERELEFLQKYLEIEQIRYRDRLKVVLNVDSQALKWGVPHMLLQPLVENSVKHGLTARECEVIVSIKALDGRLSLTVEDNGEGKCVGESFGIGLQNTRERMQRLFGNSYTLEAGARDGGGYRVAITIPKVEVVCGKRL